MKEWIKSYHIFLPGRWGKWMVYLVLPAFFFGIGYLFEKAFPDFFGGISILSTLIVSLEICMDYFIFGGIASKNTNKLEYLKTSMKGMAVLKKSLIIDAVRRFLSISLIVFGLKYAYGFGYSNRQAMALVLGYVMLSELALLITRHFSFLSLVAAGSMLISFIAPGITVLLLTEGFNRVVVIFVLGIAAMGIAAGSRILIIKKARGSYYDERDEKSL